MNKLLIVFFVGLFLVPLVLGSTYYVSTSGNDSSAGTSSSPWRTIAKAESVLQPGDTVIVRTGTYNERVTISGTSGSANSFITYQAEEGVNMNGFILRESYTKIINFNIINAPGSGVYSTGHYNLIMDNYIYNPDGYGVELGNHGNNWETTFVYGTYTDVINNTINRAVTAGVITYGHHNLIEGNDISKTWGSPSGTKDADGLRFLGHSHIIRNNYIHDIYKNDTPLAHNDCFQSWGPVYNILFEYNRCLLHTGDEFQGLMLEQLNDSLNRFSPVENITFRYNIWRFSRSGGYAPGITSVAKIASGQKQIKNLVIDHNTFIRDSVGQWAIWFENNTGVVITNNIFYNGVEGNYPENQPNVAGNIVRLYTPVSEVTADYNSVYRSDGVLLTATAPTKGVPKGAHDIWNVNPTFNNFNGLDYRPKATLANGSANPICTGSSTGSYIGAFPCVGSSTYHPADLNHDGCISLGEISAYVSLWLQGQVTLSQASSGVSTWMQGC